MAGMEAVSKPAADPGGPLVCRVTAWYFRRMGILGGMLLLMGLYFLYDGKYGYPKANGIAERKEWFEKELLASYDTAKSAGRWISGWRKLAKMAGRPEPRANRRSGRRMRRATTGRKSPKNSRRRKSRSSSGGEEALCWAV